MSSIMERVPDPEVPARARTRRFSAAYKARILAEYDGLDKADKGALLRREGLYTSLIAAWRQQWDQGALAALARPAGRPAADPRDRENARCSRCASIGCRPRCPHQAKKTRRSDSVCVRDVPLNLARYAATAASSSPARPA